MDFDIVIVGDFRFPGGTSTSIAAEVRALSKAGYRIGLVALATTDLSTERQIHPEIRALHRDGLAILVPPGEPVEAPLCCLHHPAAFAHLPAQPVLVTSRHRLLIAHHPAVDAEGLPQYDAAAITALVTEIYGPAVWAPVGPKVRQSLLRLPNPPPLKQEDWHNILDPEDFANLRPHLPRSRLPRAPVVIGRHSRPQLEKWPADRISFLGAYPADPAVRVRLMGYSAALDEITAPRPANWQVLPFGAMPVKDFLGSLDYFSYFHGPSWIEAFGRSVLEAMAAGLVCLLPPDFEPLFGDAALYCSPDQVLSEVQRLEADPAAKSALIERAIQRVHDHFGPAKAVDRVEAIIGPPMPEKPGNPARIRRGGGVLYFTSNGVGMGHLTRCTATARRLPPGLPATVITMSKAFGVVQDEGFTAEYLPFFRSAGMDPARWAQKLEAELTEILRYRAPEVFVFDGNVPYDGLRAALERFPALWKIWHRRAMWRPRAGLAQLEHSDAFDAVIEPGELAAAVDRGATVGVKNRVLRVPPIRYLDHDEALPRAAARHMLGLDSSRPAVLLQLGSGNNFDLRSPAATIFQLTDPAINSRRPQVVVARWQISETPLALPPHVQMLEAFPISRYLNAFDCAVATAGYNSFHENIAAALPTLFVPNDHPEQDEQWLRADYAALRGLALSARAEDPYEFRSAFEQLMQPQTRARLAAACANAAAALPNGAQAAADFLFDLAMTRKRSPVTFHLPAGHS